MATKPTTTRLGQRWRSVKEELPRYAGPLLASLKETSDGFRAECKQEYLPTLWLTDSRLALARDGYPALRIDMQHATVTSHVYAEMVNSTKSEAVVTLTNRNPDAYHWSGDVNDYELLVDWITLAVETYTDLDLLQFFPGYEPETEADAVTSALSQLKGAKS